MVIVRQASEHDAEWMHAGFRVGMGWAKPEGYFGGRLDQAKAGQLVVLVAEGEDGRYVGHAIVRWRSDYWGFHERNIPEIQDLNVVENVRRRGVASSLLDHAERLIATRSAMAGIGVGLDAAYGAAQRLYVKRGYVPDGTGPMHGNDALVPGHTVSVDDALVLHLVKSVGIGDGPSGQRRRPGVDE